MFSTQYYQFPHPDYDDDQCACMCGRVDLHLAYSKAIAFHPRPANQYFFPVSSVPSVPSVQPSTTGQTYIWQWQTPLNQHNLHR